MTTTAATSTVPSAIPSGVCPEGDGTTVTSPDGVEYLLSCGSDTTGNLVAQSETVNSYTECFDGCDDLDTECQGFTWIGTGSSINGAGAGNWFVLVCDISRGLLLTSPSASPRASALKSLLLHSWGAEILPRLPLSRTELSFQGQLR